jgi:hypothetical protein
MLHKGAPPCEAAAFRATQSQVARSLLWVELAMVDLLARTTSHYLLRYRYGVWAYWFANAALVVAEARWHVLTRLTVWDLATLIKLVGAMAHQHPPPV